MEGERRGWEWADAPEWQTPDKGSSPIEETRPQEALREHRESIDAKIDRTVLAYIDDFNDRLLSNEQANAEIAQELQAVTERLIASDDDNERDFLAAQRAVLLRLRNTINEGVGARIARRDDAPHAPEPLLPHADVLSRTNRVENDDLIMYDPQEVVVDMHAPRRASPPPMNGYSGETQPGVRAGDRFAS